MSSHLDLIRQLRSNADLRQQSVSSLAADFGVSESLVELALRSAQAAEPRKPSVKKVQGPKWSTRFGMAWQRVEAHTPAALVGVAALAVAVLYLRRFTPIPNNGGAFSLGTLVAMALLHMRLLYVRGEMKWAWLAIILAGLPPVLLSGFKPGEWHLALLGGFGLMFLASMYAFPAAAVGQWLRLKQEERRRKLASRTDKLGRLMEVQQMLQSGSTTVLAPLKKRLTEGRWLAIATTVNILLSSISWAAILILDPEGSILRGRPDLTPNLATTLFVMGISLASAALQIWVGFSRPQAKSAWKGLLALILSGLIINAGVFLFKGASPFSLAPHYIWANYLAGTIGTCAMVLGGSAAATVAETRRVWKMRDEGRPEALMEELIELESELALEGVPTSVLAVDVAGSTNLKAGVDPVAAEWCFREYHQRIALAASEFGGRVVSTAGDGAIVSFSDPISALSASARALALMEEFNRQGNRMPLPFRLRFGMHLGLAPRDLSEVQISRLIDVAAHLEGIAPVGGIAISDESYAVLGSPAGFLAGPEINGHATYLWPDLSSGLPSK